MAVLIAMWRCYVAVLIVSHKDLYTVLCHCVAGALHSHNDLGSHNLVLQFVGFGVLYIWGALQRYNRNKRGST